MRRKRFTRFVISYMLVGFIVALAVVWLAPGILDQTRPVVAIEQSDRSPAPAAISASPTGPVSYADAIEQATPAIVNIYTATRTPDPRNVLFDDPLFDELFGGAAGPDEAPLDTALGSGVLVSSAGHLLTNNHVIDGAEKIQIMLADGRTANATVVGTDPESDLAVLKTDLESPPHVTLGASDALRVGDVVFAIGNPFGVGQTVTQGIISALGRSELGLNTFENFIQTDAAINPGNSGGALINAKGEVIGINTAIFSQSGGAMGIGFAIPARLAQAVLTGIIENGRVIRGWIGVQIREASEITTGVVVAGVLPGGPADEAGLRVGDVIKTLNGEPIASARSLLSQVTKQPPGSQVRLTGERRGEPGRWQIGIAERPTNLGRSGPQSPPAR
jgi:serine protease DegS